MGRMGKTQIQPTGAERFELCKCEARWKSETLHRHGFPLITHILECGHSSPLFVSSVSAWSSTPLQKSGDESPHSKAGSGHPNGAAGRFQGQELAARQLRGAALRGFRRFTDAPEPSSSNGFLSSRQVLPQEPSQCATLCVRSLAICHDRDGLLWLHPPQIVPRAGRETQRGEHETNDVPPEPPEYSAHTPSSLSSK